MQVSVFEWTQIVLMKNFSWGSTWREQNNTWFSASMKKILFYFLKVAFHSVFFVLIYWNYFICLPFRPKCVCKRVCAALSCFSHGHIYMFPVDTMLTEFAAQRIT